MINEGDKAPSLTVTSSDGSEVNLAAPSQPLVVYFYPKDDTSGCTKEACGFRDNMARLTKAGAVVVGVSKDSVASHDKFKAKHYLNFTLGSDEDGKVCEAYGTWIEKSMYGRKYMGMERATYLIGADGKVLRVWRKVKVPGHAQEVLKAATSASN